MKEHRTSLPENAQRELKPGEKYEPLLSPNKTYPEVTPYSARGDFDFCLVFLPMKLQFPFRNPKKLSNFKITN